jgi:hypothetical protein
MSAEFQVVRTTEPGVIGVPNPPSPSDQALASNSGLFQPSAGFVVV